MVTVSSSPRYTQLYYDMGVARFNPDGSPDSSFAPGGKAVIHSIIPPGGNYGPSGTASAVAVQPDGKIILAGDVSGITPPASSSFAVLRLSNQNYGSTIGTFDPTTGTWYLRNSNSPGVPDYVPFAYGAPGWQPVTGDWRGNGQTNIGVFDPGTGTWYLRNSNGPGAPDYAPFPYGAPGWRPVTGDWNGDGSTTVGVVDPGSATWYLRNTNSAGAPDIAPFPYGLPGWVPVTGDWTGSGHTGIGMFDPSTGTWYLRNEDNAGPPDAGVFQYGGVGWTPVVGDWDGDGKTAIGVIDPNGTWYLRNSNSAGAPDILPFGYGLGGWTPVAGSWNFPTQLPLLAAGVPAGDPVTALDPGQLGAVVAAALARLRGAGASAGAEAVLSTARFEVGHLSGGELGLAYPATNTVVIDATAAGYGWFVDPTPLRDEAFAVGTPGSPLTALPGTAAAGRMDLLTAVLHEMGHLAGLPDQPGTGLSDGLMTDLLAPGVRRTEALDTVFARGL
jgi:hypothetical protein